MMIALGCGAAPDKSAQPGDPALHGTVRQSAMASPPAASGSSALKPSSPQSVGSERRQPGQAKGPCPAPSADAERTFARALAMFDKTTDPGPDRAMAEAIRMRLDELYRHGCHRRLDDGALLAEVTRIAADPAALASKLNLQNVGEMGILASHSTGFESWVASYRWQNGKVRTLMIVTGEAGDQEKQLLLLGYRVFQMPGAPGPLLALASTHPWMSSCWRALRFRIFAPSADPLKPAVLLNLPLSGRWCEGVRVEAKGDTVSFTYDGWGGPWSRATVQRSYTLSYRYVSSAFEERFGFPTGFEPLAEDWLTRRWALSREATVDDARDRLKPIHEMLHQKIIDIEKSPSSAGGSSEFTSELFPVSDAERRLVLYCAVGGTSKPCAKWPKPVDVYLQRSGGLWRVKDVKPRR
jgi:hypothetical protein